MNESRSVERSDTEAQGQSSLIRATVLVIGAGPAGLATAKCLKDMGISVVLVDRTGLPGGAYVRMYPELHLASPATFLTLPGSPLGDHPEYINASFYASYLVSYANKYDLVIARGTVGMVREVKGMVEVTIEGQGTFPFLAAVIATGMYDHPFIPTIPGLTLGSRSPYVIHERDWRGPRQFPGHELLIVGGGIRGVELAEECALSGIFCTISVRGSHTRRWPAYVLGVDPRYFVFPILHRMPTFLFRKGCNNGLRFRPTDRGFGEFCRRGQIHVRPEVVKFLGNRAYFRDDSTLDVNSVILATGYRFQMPFLAPEILRTADGHPSVRRGRCASLQQVYFIGIPCAFRPDSQFIHGIAADAQTLAHMIIQRHAFYGKVQ